MRNQLLLSLAAAGALLVSHAATARGGPFAGAVVSYNPGAGFAPGYTNTSAVLGPPSAADSYGDAVDPFDPAWQTNQILSIGAGGWLTVQFDPPVVQEPGNAFGRDFIIFGNSFFDVTNFSAAPSLWATSGQVINDGGQTRVSVSRDGAAFYTLNPALAPTVNYLFPTDASGNFQLPVDPGLAPSNFAGATLAGVAALYQGAAGGASFAIAWAQDTNGNPVSLYDIRYVRVDVLSGRAQVAGIAAVTNTTGQRVLVEDFVHDPAADGWGIFGDTNLFVWDPAGQDLKVTWDTSRPNSYFFHPLQTIVGKSDDFSMSFDLYLTDVEPGIDPALPYGFEMAAGFQNQWAATQPDYIRGGDALVPDIVELTYFPGNDATVWPFVCGTNSAPNWNGRSDYTLLSLPTGVTLRVTMTYASSNQTLFTTITANNAPIGAIDPVPLAPAFGDFRADTFAVMSYSGAGQDTNYAGASLLASGTVGNIVLTFPPPPAQFFAGAFSNGFWQGWFLSRTNWTYTVQRSADLNSWSSAVSGLAGTGGNLAWQDTNTVARWQFYRVSAQRN
ncbi:MAG: hypothetical protein ABSH38_18360 [Verrucomicrobiota bacterium]|jgi:hypothetical protein